MQGKFRCALAILATLGVGCATTIDVSIDHRRPLEGDRTWDFPGLPTGNVRAPGDDAESLNAVLMKLVERCLESRGFTRVRAEPDLYVSYVLQVERQYVVFFETPAVESVQSLDHSVSYEVQASRRRFEMQEAGRLTIFVTDREERTVLWRGGFEGRFKGRLTRHLKEGVANLLGRLPAPELASDPDSVEDLWALATPSGTCVPRD